MKWCRNVAVSARLRDLRPVGAAPAPAALVVEDTAREREEAAFQRGLAEGQKRVSEEVARRQAELLEVQNGVLASLRQAATGVVRQGEAALVQLALEVARKLVADLPISEELVAAAVRSALAQLEEATEFDIFLNPEDLALLQRCNSPALLPGPGQEALRFHGAAEVSRGGCLVESRFGTLDARRETKLALIEKSLAS